MNNPLLIRAVGVSIIVNILLFGVVFSDIVWKLIGVDGFYAGIVAAAYTLFIFVPIAALVAGAIVAYSYPEHRIRSFFITVCVSLIVTFISFSILKSIERANVIKEYEQMWEKNPMSRPLLDPLRPITIIEPSLEERVSLKLGQNLRISVYARDDVFQNQVIPVKALYWEAEGSGIKRKDLQLGQLSPTGIPSQDGQSIYVGEVTTPEFTPDGNPLNSIIIIIGNGEYIDSISIDSR